MYLYRIVESFSELWYFALFLLYREIIERKESPGDISTEISEVKSKVRNLNIALINIPISLYEQNEFFF